LKLLSSETGKTEKEPDSSLSKERSESGSLQNSPFSSIGRTGGIAQKIARISPPGKD
jgi:hypothetical protein